MNKENENKVTLSTERLVLRGFNEKDFFSSSCICF